METSIIDAASAEQLPVVSFEQDDDEQSGQDEDSRKSKRNAGGKDKTKTKTKKKQSASGTPRKPGGTFASMSLSRPILRAIERKGYKLATPIQRKCIPPIMLGKDVVAMARTGSGKSAAFLLPIIDRLKIRQPKADIRALVISPTRELALQTLKFVREFAKFTNLSSKLIIGGESIGRDFETISSCPDILVATPGRLAHVLVEMKKKLDQLEVVVFDEADRLFEPGFKEMEQVNEICSRMPESKQTLLFSATMPQRLADFAKADLKEPVFVRLDVEANLSETLKSIHLHCNQSDKFAIMLHLLKIFTKQDQMLVVFMPTRHHIEYAKSLLDNTGLKCSYVYSSMDPEARRINIDKFTRKHCRVMLVTDIAARGIDIPLLDIVINFNFPFKPKLYVHRVGRVARAGRSGCAISLVAHDETPYLHALQMFLDQPLTTASQVSSSSASAKLDAIASVDDLPDKILGTVPQEILDDENDILNKWHEHNEDLKAMVKVCDNAMKPYLKTREPPAPLSVKVAKELHRRVMGTHPLFRLASLSEATAQARQAGATESGHVESASIGDKQTNLLDRIKSYKPQATIFEVGHIKGNQKTEAFGVMQKKRQIHDRIACKRQKTGDESVSDLDCREADDDDDAGVVCDDVDIDEDDDDGQDNGLHQQAKRSTSKSVNMRHAFQDSKFYLKYQPDDYAKEKGLELDKGASFNNDLKRATFDLVADDENELKRQRHQMIWDRKKKKYVRAGDLEEKKSKKIKTESGAYISASYSSGLYEKWKNQSKVEQRVSDDDDDGGGDDDENIDGGAASNEQTRPDKFGRRGASRQQPGRLTIDKLRSKLKPTKRRRELKNPEEMLKERNIKEKREAILRIKTMKKAQRNATKSGGGSGGSGKAGGGKFGNRAGAKKPGGRAIKFNKQKSSGDSGKPFRTKRGASGKGGGGGGGRSKRPGAGGGPSKHGASGKRPHKAGGSRKRS